MILRPWVPTARLDDQRASRHAAQRARRNGYQVTEIPCRADTDWPFAFAHAWDTLEEELVVVEHDVAPTLRQLEELHSCTEPAAACVFAYRLHPRTDYNPGDAPVYAHRRLVSGKAVLLTGAGVFATTGPLEDHPEIPRARWIQPLEQRCELAAFGLIRFRSAARAVTLPKLVSWRHMDTVVSGALTTALGQSWCHVHWPPVRHDHDERHPNPPALAPVTPIRL